MKRTMLYHHPISSSSRVEQALAMFAKPVSMIEEALQKSKDLINLKLYRNLCKFEL